MMVMFTVARRSSTVQGIYRYHVDTLSVELVDSGAYGDGNPQGIAIGGTGSEQIIIVSTSDGKVHSFLNDGSTTAHTKEMMIDDPNAIFWDITTGDKDQDGFMQLIKLLILHFYLV